MKHLRGLFFVCPPPSQGYWLLELLNSIYFSIINIKSGCLFACRRVIGGLIRATEELFDYNFILILR